MQFSSLSSSSSSFLLPPKLLLLFFFFFFFFSFYTGGAPESNNLARILSNAPLDPWGLRRLNTCISFLPFTCTQGSIPRKSDGEKRERGAREKRERASERRNKRERRDPGIHRPSGTFGRDLMG